MDLFSRFCIQSTYQYLSCLINKSIEMMNALAHAASFVLALAFVFSNTPDLFVWYLGRPRRLYFYAQFSYEFTCDTRRTQHMEKQTALAYISSFAIAKSSIFCSRCTYIGLSSLHFLPTVGIPHIQKLAALEYISSSMLAKSHNFHLPFPMHYRYQSARYRYLGHRSPIPRRHKFSNSTL